MATSAAVAEREPCGLIHIDGRSRCDTGRNALPAEPNRPLQSLHSAQVSPLASERHSTVPAGCAGETWNVLKPAAIAALNESAVSVEAMKYLP